MPCPRPDEKKSFSLYVNLFARRISFSFTFTFHERYHEQNIKQELYDNALDATQKFHLLTFSQFTVAMQSYLWNTYERHVFHVTLRSMKKFFTADILRPGAVK